MTKLLKTTWIHSLRREQLLAIAEEFQLDIEGTVEDIRRRFLHMVTTTTHDEKVQKRLAEIDLEETGAETLTVLETQRTRENNEIIHEGTKTSQRAKYDVE